MQSQVVLLDNGAGRIKFGKFNGKSDCNSNELPVPNSMPNSIAKIAKQMQELVGDDIDEVINGSVLQYSRPFDRGYLNNWGKEIDIWNRVFSQKHLSMTSNSIADSSLIMTEPIMNPEPWQNDTNEVIYEYFGFKSSLRKPAAWFSAYHNQRTNPCQLEYPKCSLVIDSGFSYSHIIPFFHLKCSKYACKRINVGGKLLTNYLKEVISYRQWNMMDEFKLIDQVKEELGFITTDFNQELNQLRTKRLQSTDPMGGKLRKYFVLPDFQNIQKGYVKEDDIPNNPEDQVLTMESERFTISELLFTPSDIGIECAGIAEASAQSLSLLNPIEMSLSAANIILTGGNIKFNQFEDRYHQDLRPLVSDNCEVHVFKPDDPDIYAWRGQYLYAQDVYNNQYPDEFITKADYLEKGHYYCNEKFSNSW